MLYYIFRIYLHFISLNPLYAYTIKYASAIFIIHLFPL